MNQVISIEEKKQYFVIDDVFPCLQSKEDSYKKDQGSKMNIQPRVTR